MADPPKTPPAWLNGLMGFLLRVPGSQELIGRSTALLTFTGRNTRRQFTTPVSYSLADDTVIMTAHSSRMWWRNLASQPNVVLRLKGHTAMGKARAVHGDAARAHLIEFFAAQRMVARSVGVRVNRHGHVDLDSVERILADTVVVLVELER